LRVLAVAGTERSRSFPDVPRLAAFYPGLEITPWLALFGPAGLPPVVLDRLRTETARLLADPDMREKIRNVGGLDPYQTTPEEFGALLRAEYVRYGEIVKAAGAKID